VVYVNQVGGNDSLVFDGTSFAMDAQGHLLACAPSFREELIFVDFDTRKGDQSQNLPDECEAAYEALVLGTGDYIRKCGFKRVLLGLSGGVDSSLTAVIAADAVGPRTCGRRHARPVFLSRQHHRCPLPGAELRHQV